MIPTREPSLRRASFGLMVANGITLVLAVGVPYATARAFGTSADLDAYVVAIAVFTFLADWFLKDSSNMVLVPALKRAWSTSSDGSTGFAAFRSIVCFYAVFTTIGVLVCELLAGPIVRLVAAGFDASSRALAERLLRVSVLVLLPAMGACVTRASLNAAGRYLLPTWGVAAQSTLTIACILSLAPHIGVWALPVGLLAGAVASLTFQVPGFLKLRIPLFGARPQTFRGVQQVGPRGQYGTLAAFFSIGIAAHIHVLADRYFASLLPVGSVAILAYAEKFRFPVMALFALSVSIPAFTLLSGAALAQDTSLMASQIRQGVRIIALTTLPFVAILVCLRLPLTRLWLEHGSFGPAATREVSAVFLSLAPAFFVNALSTLLLAAFFAIGAHWTIAAVVCAEIALNIVLAWALVGPLGVPGLGLATSAATSLSNIALWWILSRRMGGLGFGREMPFLGRVLAATAAACAVTIAFDAIPQASHRDLLPLLSAGAGCLAYVVFASVLGIEEMHSLLAHARRRAGG